MRCVLATTDRKTSTDYFMVRNDKIEWKIVEDGRPRGCCYGCQKYPLFGSRTFRRLVYVAYSLSLRSARTAHPSLLRSPFGRLAFGASGRSIREGINMLDCICLPVQVFRLEQIVQVTSSCIMDFTLCAKDVIDLIDHLIFLFQHLHPG